MSDKHHEQNNLFKTTQQIFDFLMVSNPPTKTSNTTQDPKAPKTLGFMLSSEKKFVHDVLEINENPEHKKTRKPTKEIPYTNPPFASQKRKWE